jgi:hypothetical protein
MIKSRGQMTLAAQVQARQGIIRGAHKYTVMRRGFYYI